MNEYLKFKKANCKHCYKCIRHCPVKSISFGDNQANIVQDECILCGQCFVTCPQNTKSIRDDLPRVKELLASGAPVYASVAPSFLANYPGVSFADMEASLKKLGFAGAGETAEGATVVKRKYDEMVEAGESSVIISSCCSSVNMLIQKYFPEALPYLAQVASPMQAHCAAIKKEDPQAKTVFIGPCISKKAEADQYPDIVDSVMTFEQLSDWMKDEDVALAASEGDVRGKARLFPTSGGILRSMEQRNKNYSYITVDGMENCIAAIKDVVAGSMENCFIEMSACVGSCVGGPVMERQNRMRSTVTVDRAAGAEDFVVEQPAEAELAKKIIFMPLKKSLPGKKAIDDVLKKIGKTLPEHELNCGSCGYDTCRDKAAAVLMGKAEISMCLPYLSDRAQSFSDTIIKNTPNGIVVLNEALEVQQINDAACELLNITSVGDVLGRNVVCILEPYPFIDTVESGKNIYENKVYLAEYQKYVRQTVLYDKSYNVLICIMRDITEKEQERSHKDEMNERAIEITDRVIEKQMRTVQEIASLLGETTAETKVALTKLKETLSDE